MKLFLYEHITSGALCEHALPTRLAQEGDLMLQAALHDALACDTLDIITLRDSRLSSHSASARLQSYTINTRHTFDLAWKKALEQADAALIIAPEVTPENDDLLAKLNQQVLDKGKILFGCQPEAVRLSSNKHQCNQLLTKQGLHTPAESIASQWQQSDFAAPQGFIIKPLHGVGCENTYHYATADQVTAWQAQHTSEVLDHILIQAFMPGIAASLSVLCGEQQAHVFAINQQEIRQQNHRLHFSGCTVNGIDNALLSHADAGKIAAAVQAAIPGLYGWIGIDLILGENTPIIIDINPRLTTSYAGLAASLKCNPIQFLIDRHFGTFQNLPPKTPQNAVKIAL